MAYNKINKLKKIIQIQEITFFQKHKKGLYLKEIYYEIIEKKYFISYKTFHTYLETPAKRELKKITTEDEYNTTINQIREDIKEYLIK